MPFLKSRGCDIVQICGVGFYLQYFGIIISHLFELAADGWGKKPIINDSPQARTRQQKVKRDKTDKNK